MSETAVLRTYERTGTGNITVDLTGADGILVLCARTTITAATIDGKSLVSSSSDHVWFFGRPSQAWTTLSLTLAASYHVYVLILQYGNTLIDSVYDYDSSINQYDWFPSTVETVDGGYAAMEEYLSDSYVSNETTGWTNDYNEDGTDGKVISKSRRVATDGEDETYTVRSDNSSSKSWYRAMASVGYTPPQKVKGTFLTEFGVA